MVGRAVRLRDLALVLLVVLLWGVNFVVIKVGLRGVSPFVLAGLRFTFTALPAIFFLRRPRLPLRVYAGFALTTFFLQFALLFWAIKVGMPAGLSSLVHQSQVFFTVLLAAVVLGERPRPVQLAGMLVAALGLVGIAAGTGTAFPLAALLLNLGAAAAWAAGNLVSRSLARHGEVNALAFVVWAALPLPVPFFALAWAVEGTGAVTASLGAMDGLSWAAVAYLAFGSTLAGYGIWSRLLRTYPAAQVARFALLVPVVGLLCGWLLLAERLSAAQLAGCALVVAGLALPVAARRRGVRAAAPWRRRYLSAMARTVTRAVSIAAPAAEVFQLVADPTSLARYAPGFARAVKPDGGAWRVESIRGPLRLDRVLDEAARTVDFRLTAPDGRTNGVFTRAIEVGPGTEFVFTLELPGTASEDAVAAQGRIVEEELAQLKRICEGG
jgi:O-acetylserine/cysteine efflux transporter